MNSALLARKFIVALIFVSICKVALADSATLNNGGTTTNQQNIDEEGEFLTVSDNSTLNTGASKPANVTGDNVDVTVESGSTITSTTVSIFADNTSDLTVTNSGTISATGTTAIDVKGTTDATIVNNSGGKISSNTNTIRISKTGSNNTTGLTITNSGTITTTTKSAIFGTGANNTVTITNKSGGEITNSDSLNATIRVGASSTIVNSGTIKNNVSDDAIKLYGNNATITLKDGGIVVGKIDALSRTGSTLKFNHGFGQGYFYETEGDFTLEDLDGNQVVKGSAGSVGQGGSETLDELLGYKSLNIRKSLNRYKKSKSFIEGKDSWGEAYVSNLKRKENNNNLAIGYDHKTFGINLINPLQSSHFMLSLEHSKQDLLQDHSITRYGILTGLYFPQLKNLGKFETENFVSAGITLNDSERTILTNTTTSGILNVTDTYETYEVIAGKKFKYFDNLSNINLIPDIGITVGYSLTPSHSESKYFIWDKKHVANLTASLSDEYSIQISGNTNLSVGWIGDFRRLITEQKQKYEINSTKATFSPGNELKNEITFAGNIGLKHNFSKHGLISFNLDGSHSTQDTNNITGYIAMEIKF